MIRPADGPDPLDQDFPLGQGPPPAEDFLVGDGTAERTATAWCPCCGEEVELVLDPGGGALQEYVEDCPVCCRPWQVTAQWDAEGRVSVELESEDG